MSHLLFDVPGPRARRRHLIYTAIASIVLLALVSVVLKKLYDAGSLTPEVFNDAFQNQNVEFLAKGFVLNIKAAVLAITLSIAFGALFAVGQLSDRIYLRWPATLVVQLGRALPVVMMMLVAYFAFKEVLGTLGAVVAGLTVYNGSVLAEVFRAGINAVPNGQSEAAYAVGLRKGQVTRLVLMPQAVRFMLPSIISQCVIVLKDTSLGYVIVYFEVVRRSKLVAQSVPDGSILVYSTVALAFIVINYGLSKLAQFVERRMSGRGGGTIAKVDPEGRIEAQGVPGIPL
jgi:glutamate transport system permease protein